MVPLSTQEICPIIKDLKKEYGITSQAALDYIRVVKDHEALRDIVLKELKQESKPFYFPTVREVSNILDSVMYYTNSSAYSYPLNKFYDQESTDFDYHSFLKKYISKVAKTRRPKDELLTEVLQEFAPEEFVPVDIKASGKYFRSEALNKCNTAEEEIFLHRNETLQEIWEFKKGGAYLSAFSRGALENTLHHLDTERGVALSYVHTHSKTSESPSQRIASALREIEFDIALSNVESFEFNNTELYVRQGIRKKFERNEEGLPKKSELEYRKKRALYEYRAIIENQSWLEKILA